MTDATLVRALLARALRPTVGMVILAVAAVGGAGALGRHLAEQGLLAEGATPLPVAGGGLGALLLWQLGRALALPYMVTAAWLALSRVGSDEGDGWLAPLAAGGASRATYLLAVAAGALLVSLTAYLPAALAFAGAAATISPSAARSALATIPGVLPALASAVAYAALCVTIAPRGGRALTLALAGALLPIVAVSWWQLAQGAPPPRLAVRLAALHLPPFSWSSAPSVVAQHVVYTLAALTLAARLAPARLGRAT